MSCSFLNRIMDRIEAKSLLNHPFYQAWKDGKLSHQD